MRNGHDITRASDTERVQRGLARSFPVTRLFPDLDVHENLRLAAQAGAGAVALARKQQGGHGDCR